MNRQKIYFIMFIGIILAIVSFDLFITNKLDHKTNRELAQQPQPTVDTFIKSNPLKPVVKAKTLKQKQLEERVTPEFLAQFKEESEQIGRPQKNIEQLENRLQSWARHLDENEIDYLSSVIKDRDRGGDERAMALDLLGRNQSSQSLTNLKEFVLSEGTGAGDARSRLDEELIFKVQAVEEIAASSSPAEAMSHLNEIQNQTEQSFVKDRAQRSLSSLKGLAPSTESQDNSALKKMIE